MSCWHQWLVHLDHSRHSVDEFLVHFFLVVCCCINLSKVWSCSLEASCGCSTTNYQRWYAGVARCSDLSSNHLQCILFIPFHSKCKTCCVNEEGKCSQSPSWNLVESECFVTIERNICKSRFFEVMSPSWWMVRSSRLILQSFVLALKSLRSNSPLVFGSRRLRCRTSFSEEFCG